MINLSNFEQPQFATSQYILTSPRSLRACAKLNIKPIELLHKPLSEFEEQLKPLGVSESSIYASFCKYDEERKEKLRRAKDERRKMQEREKEEPKTEKPAESFVSPTSWRDMALVGESIGPKKVDIKKTSSMATKKRPISGGVTFAEAGRRSLNLNHPPVQSQSSLKTRSASQKSMSEIALADIPDRDKKILALMVARREEKKAWAEMQVAVSKDWIEQKEKAVKEQEIMEQKYREEVVRRNKERKEMQERQKKQRTEEEKRRDEFQKALLEKEVSGWDERAERIQDEKLQKLEMKCLEEMKKKQFQEVKLKQLEEEDSISRFSTQERLEQSLARAEEKREKMEIKRKFELQEKNLKERLAHERLKIAIRRNEEEDRAYVRASIVEKHARAEERVLAHLVDRDKGIKANRLKQIERERERKATVEKLREDVEDWKLGVSLRQKAALAKAEVVVAKGVEEKARAAYEQRVQREQEHQRIVQRLRKEEEGMRQLAEEEIRLKDLRSQAVMREKEAEVQKSREIARASEQLRMKILGSDSNRTFGFSKSRQF